LKEIKVMTYPRPSGVIRLVLGVLILIEITACATSPTGQPQLKFFPEDQMAEMGQAAYQEIKQKTPVSQDTGLNQYVQCVAQAITRIVAPDTSWEVTVFQDKSANAFALPGGKIGVNTGLLEVATNQHQLATVIGHEIAHVQANHGNARMSASSLTQAGLTLAQVFAGATSPEKQQLIGLLGAGAQIGILLPYGRSQESEADHLGLEYMARAGFDPRESVNLWRNMSAASGSQPPEFLSTHPSHGTRIEQLEAQMPTALNLYQQAQSQGSTPNCKP
jgi:predicted Zn-dependent protease